MKFLKKHSWLWVILFTLFIFSNSLTPSVASKLTSSTITTAVHQFLSMIHFEIDFEILHYLIRKMAHFLEYALLGILISTAINSKPLIKHRLFHYLIFFIIPIIDENLQKVTPGRSCEVTDMLIDSSGMIFGFFCVYITYQFLRYKKERGHYEK